MLRPLRRLFPEFVSQDAVRTTVHVPQYEVGGWKIVLLGIYGSDTCPMDDARYAGEDQVRAITICQQWNAVGWLWDFANSAFRAFCIRAVTLTRLIKYSPESECIHDHILMVIEKYFYLYHSVFAEHAQFPNWAFGLWAIRAINPRQFTRNFDSLSEPFQRQIAVAVINRAMYIACFYEDDGILLSDVPWSRVPKVTMTMTTMRHFLTLIKP
ncbi:hypothetical protein F5X99DRAFT_432367 [Biscogniauxia marginata]|nr:hypothetical protein F5X99DRAFT_432367 [Biscogniauxia marginata]